MLLRTTIQAVTLLLHTTTMLLVCCCSRCVSLIWAAAVTAADWQVARLVVAVQQADTITKKTTKDAKRRTKDVFRPANDR